MPISGTTSRSAALEEAINRLREGEQPFIDIHKSSEYPTFLVLTHQSEYADNLLSRAFELGPIADSCDEYCLRTEQNRHRRTALFRFQKCGVQITDAKPTTHSDSVLGRIGVLDILCELLTLSLGLPKEEEITFADLARLADKNQATAAAKLYGRLNRGEFVHAMSVKRLAEAVRVPFDQFCFFHSTIYTIDARRRRGKQRGTVRGEQRRALQSHPLTFTPLDTGNPQQVLRFSRGLLRASSVEPEKLPQAPTEPQASAIARLLDAVELAQNDGADAPAVVATALVNLAHTGMTAWIAEYEDRVAVPPDDEERQYWPELRARAERKLVLAFTADGKKPPRTVVNLSHVLELRPTIDELMRSFD